MDKRLIGILGEKLVCKWYTDRKYKLVGINYKTRFGEIDIIAQNRNTIVFVEVKTRTVVPNSRFEYETPASSVTYTKQRRILAAAQTYLNVHPSKKTPRLDVIEVYLSQNCEILKINHMEDAFTN